MYLTRWKKADASAQTAFGQLFDLRDELDRLFGTPFAELTHASRFFDGWTPAEDLYEDKDNFVVKAELPGMKREDIEVSLHEGALTVSGERKSEEKHTDAETRREESFYGRFQRTIALPKAVKADAVAARYQDGVLTITLPKSEEVKPKQIEVKVK